MNSRLALCFLLLLAMVALAGCTGEAPVATGPKPIYVQVTDASGHGQPNIDVLLLNNTKTTSLASATTDLDGRATLALNAFNAKTVARLAVNYWDDGAYDLITDALPVKAFDAGVKVTYGLDRYAAGKSLTLTGVDADSKKKANLGGCLLEWLPDDRSHDYVGATVSEGSIPGLIEVLGVVQAGLDGSCLLGLPATDDTGKAFLVSVDVGGKQFKALGRLAAASLDMSFNGDYAVLTKKDLAAGTKGVAGDFGGPAN